MLVESSLELLESSELVLEPSLELDPVEVTSDASVDVPLVALSVVVLAVVAVPFVAAMPSQAAANSERLLPAAPMRRRRWRIWRLLGRGGPGGVLELMTSESVRFVSRA